MFLEQTLELQEMQKQNLKADKCPALDGQIFKDVMVHSSDRNGVSIEFQVLNLFLFTNFLKESLSIRISNWPGENATTQNASTRPQSNPVGPCGNCLAPPKNHHGFVEVHCLHLNQAAFRPNL